MSVPSQPGSARGALFSVRSFWIAFALFGVLLVALANVHLVLVAVGSQPDCVAATSDGSGPAPYRAAKPAC